MRIKNLVLLALPVAFLASCNGGNNHNSTEEGKLKITTTFAPMYDFTKRIVGDKADVITLVGNNEPHGFTVTNAKDMAFASESDLVVAYGQDMDPYAEKLNQNKYFVATEGVDFKTSSELGGTSGDTIDPHAWLAIDSAEIMMRNIAAKVIEIDASNKDYYTENLNDSLAEFDALKDKYAAELSAVKGKTLVTAHEAFGYVAKEFGFHQYGIEDVGDNEAGSAQIAKAIDFIKENGIKYICVEELDEESTADTIIAELKKSDYEVQKVEISAFEGVDVNEWAQEDNYISVMNENLSEFVEYLK